MGPRAWLRRVHARPRFYGDIGCLGGGRVSVLQVRAQDVLPEAMAAPVLQALRQFERELGEGALVSVDLSRARVRVLPLRKT